MNGITNDILKASAADQALYTSAIQTSLTADASLRSGVNVTYVPPVELRKLQIGLQAVEDVKVIVEFDVDRQQYLDAATGVATMKSVFGDGSAFVVTLKAAATAAENADFAEFTAATPVYSEYTTTIVNLLAPSASPTVSFAPSASPSMAPSAAPSAGPTRAPTTATPTSSPTFKTG